MQNRARWSLLAVISLLLAAQTFATMGEIDRLLGARIERNCFFSPMGCMFLPGKKLSRVRRLPVRAERIQQLPSSSWFI
ncbi:hypothetical protein Y032_0022g648 [Ancylostoma ceylanicum]|uniref:Uncharacterized protein n=1 Tax=Ancylostoma ceylanicum TaxID=53326 RepID=A0A016UYI4_9BILA|nr:hypothetical protein Y032_0022g648 [Ancylostoma ceylanicum]